MALARDPTPICKRDMVFRAAWLTVTQASVSKDVEWLSEWPGAEERLGSDDISSLLTDPTGKGSLTLQLS